MMPLIIPLTFLAQKADIGSSLMKQMLQENKTLGLMSVDITMLTQFFLQFPKHLHIM
jgi:hypothetical protein